MGNNEMCIFNWSNEEALDNFSTRFKFLFCSGGINYSEFLIMDNLSKL